jgi:hypothetical protein
MMKLAGLKRLGAVGLVGERKALALLCLGFYATLFFLIWINARTELPEWAPCFFGMMAIYLTAFFGVASGWFWGRWFATGIGYSGVTMAMMSLVATRDLPPVMIIFATMHGLVALALMGDRMAADYDARTDWRERWHLDEQGVVRIRKSVIRAASSLPALVMFALAPREQAGAYLPWVLGLAALGLCGLLARRTFGVLALAAGGVATLWLATTGGALEVQPLEATPFLHGVSMALIAGYAGVLLLAAASPFARPAVRFLRSR